MTTYTLICFTEGEDGWYDRCSDYHEGEPSELDISYFNDPKECGFMWAYNERQYETTKLLIDGKDPWDEYDEALISFWDEADKYRGEQSDILKAEHDKRKAEELAEQARKKAEEERKRQARIELNEREQLAELLKKYGDTK